MRDRRNDAEGSRRTGATASIRGRWGIAMAAAAALAVSVGVVMAVAAPDRGRDGARGTAAAGGTVSVSPAGSSTAPPMSPAPTVAASPALSPSPTADPTALADGAYPAYVRSVDVAGATVTVDVIQTFEGLAAVRAALEDGLPRRDARAYRYVPVYVRNENPLLRTLPVGEHVEIRFVGECEEPGTRTAALRELRRAVRTSDATTFYYLITLDGGSVTGVDQRVAVPAC